MAGGDRDKSMPGSFCSGSSSCGLVRQVGRVRHGVYQMHTFCDIVVMLYYQQPGLSRHCLRVGCDYMY